MVGDCDDSTSVAANVGVISGVFQTVICQSRNTILNLHQVFPMNSAILAVITA